MKRLLLLILSAFFGAVALLPCRAEGGDDIIVLDAINGQPVIQASVYDEQGKIIGVTNAEGRLPDITGTEHIRITHIAYQSLDIKVSHISPVLRLQPMGYRLKEVVKEKKKKKSYCLKLTCYYRQYLVNSKGTQDELPPVVCFVDGICNLYVFSNLDKTTRRVQLAHREVITDRMIPTEADEDMPSFVFPSFPDLHNDYPDLAITVQRDSTARAIKTVYDALAPLKSRKVDLLIARENNEYETFASPQMVMDSQHAVYQLSPYSHVSQGDLLAYSEIKQLKGTLRRKGHEDYAMDLWLFDDYFPLEAELLTKEEYKTDRNAQKNQPLSLSPAEIDRYTEGHPIPELTQEMQLKLNLTRQRMPEYIAKSTSTKPHIEIGQRKGMLLVMLHDYEGADSLACIVKGGGNDLSVNYNKGKVLRINGEMLRAGDVTITIVDKQSETVVAETKTSIRIENAIFDLPEVVATGKRTKRKPFNSYNMEAPRGYKPGDPRIERAANMQQLLTSLGIRITYYQGIPYITTPDNAGLAIYVDNLKMETDEHEEVLSLIPTDVKTIEYFTPNDPVNGIFGVRPDSYSGKVPGVLFIFLKDGSEVSEQSYNR